MIGKGERSCGDANDAGCATCLAAASSTYSNCRAGDRSGNASVTGSNKARAVIPLYARIDFSCTACPRTKKRIRCSTSARRPQNSSFQRWRRINSSNWSSVDATRMPLSSKSVSASRLALRFPPGENASSSRMPRWVRSRSSSEKCRWLMAAFVRGNESHASALNVSCQLSLRTGISPRTLVRTSY